MFNSENEFEEALIFDLTTNWSWDKKVLEYPTEEDLIQNWADILYKNNCDKDKLNGKKLTRDEMQQIIDHINNLKTPMKLNEFINGRSVTIKRNGKEISLKIYDRKQIAKGESCYQIAKQPKFRAKSSILPDRRGDLMLLINGMPVIHIELKNDNVPLSEACNQIQKYSKEGVFSQGIFSLVQIFVAMKPDDTVYFANPGQYDKFNKDFYFHWANFNNEPYRKWKDISQNLLSIPMAHQLIGFYTVADKSDGILKVLRSYQYFAASKIADKVNIHNQLGGYVWHTTGSGKTLTSFKTAQLIASSKDADKVILLVDRTELADQSYKDYLAYKEESESVQDTKNTYSLIKKLKSKDSMDILIVTSIQKLSKITEEKVKLKKHDIDKILQKKIVIIVDECHRSTLGKMLASIKSTLKNAIFFGFTGTPLLEGETITTADIFGDEIHRYSIANGITDRNVLGFDPYSVKVYQDIDVKKKVALYEAKADTEIDAISDENKRAIYNKYMNEVDMCTIEEKIPNEQYRQDEYRRLVVDNIKDNWITHSQNSKFHAIFATSSIREAIEYYRVFKDVWKEIKVTALFSYEIDNKGEASLDKEDGVVEIIEDYNKQYSKNFSIPTFDSFKKDISLRLAHKDPYKNIKEKDQLDILIVVNQMLTGFDSKFINTLYLDKELSGAAFIQAISRTNRIYDNIDKPFGIIKWYRRPNTMKKNLDEAIKLYSGEVAEGLFVDKLPKNVEQMNKVFEDIKALFLAFKIENFEKLPEEDDIKAKFAKYFAIFSKHLKAALIQGFKWDNEIYDEVKLQVSRKDYNKLKVRYEELVRYKTRNKKIKIPFEIEPRLAEQTLDRIDADYMNTTFNKWTKELKENSSNARNLLIELSKSFASLPQEKQKIANVIIHNIQDGTFIFDNNKTLTDYINEKHKKINKRKIREFSNLIGCSEKELTKLCNIDGGDVNDIEINDLVETINQKRLSEYCKDKFGVDYKEKDLGMYATNEIKEFFIKYGSIENKDLDYEKLFIEEDEEVETIQTEDNKIIEEISKLTVGDAIKYIIETKNISSKDLQSLTGLGKITLSNIYQNKNISKENLIKICDSLNLSNEIKEKIFEK